MLRDYNYTTLDEKLKKMQKKTKIYKINKKNSSCGWVGMTLPWWLWWSTSMATM
jgi:hypothetical protein